MDLYEKKRRAFILIDKMVADGVPIEKIRFKVATIYGFGDKVVDNRVKQLEQFVKMHKTPDQDE